MTTEELLELRNQLNERTDALNARIDVFEADLQKLAIGLPAWIKTDGNVHIGYTKFENKWQLVVKYDEHGTEVFAAASRSKRSMRLHVVKHMKEIVPALEESIKEFIERVDKVLNG